MESAEKYRVAKQIIEDGAFWQNHLLAQAGSGLSKSAYCRVHKVDYGRFVYWSKKLSISSVAAISPLVPVTLQKPPEKTADNVLCMLQLKNGHRLHIYDAQVLSTLLEKLG
jgi:hypothetical protein